MNKTSKSKTQHSMYLAITVLNTETDERKTIITRDPDKKVKEIKKQPHLTILGIKLAN